MVAFAPQSVYSRVLLFLVCIVKIVVLSDASDANGYIQVHIGHPYNTVLRKEGLISWVSGTNRTDELIEVRRTSQFTDERPCYQAMLKGDLLYSGLRGAGPIGTVSGENVNVLFNDGTYIVYEGPSDVWITVDIPNPCGEMTTIVHHFVDSGDSNNYFSLSPNPATNFVNINFLGNEKISKRLRGVETPFVQIQLWEINGLIKQVRTTQADYVLDLAGVPKGIYYIRVIKNGQRFHQPLIVK